MTKAEESRKDGVVRREGLENDSEGILTETPTNKDSQDATAGLSFVVHVFVDALLTIASHKELFKTVHELLDTAYSFEGTMEEMDKHVVERALEEFGKTEPPETQKDDEVLKTKFIEELSGCLCEREGHGNVRADLEKAMVAAGFGPAIEARKKKVRRNFRKAENRLDSATKVSMRLKIEELLRRMRVRGGGLRKATENYEDAVLIAQLCKKQKEGWSPPKEEEIWKELIEFKSAEEEGAVKSEETTRNDSSETEVSDDSRSYSEEDSEDSDEEYESPDNEEDFEDSDDEYKSEAGRGSSFRRKDEKSFSEDSDEEETAPERENMKRNRSCLLSKEPDPKRQRF